MKHPTFASETLLMTLKIFERWDIPKEEWDLLLGASLKNLIGHDDVDSLITDDLIKRTTTLLNIYKALGNLFPHDRDLAHEWIKQKNRAFDQKSPAELIKLHGLIGIQEIESYLMDAIHR